MLYPRCGKDFVYAHVTGHAVSDSWLNFPMDLIWDIFCRCLNCYYQPSELQLHAFVLMSNHFHLLITTDGSKTAEFANSLVTAVQSEVQKLAGRSYSLFEAVPDQFPITDLTNLRHVYRYIYQNPVRAGLVQRAEDYPYSTLGYLLGRINKGSKLPFIDTFGIIYDPMRMLRWINDIDGTNEHWSRHY